MYIRHATSIRTPTNIISKPNSISKKYSILCSIIKYAIYTIETIIFFLQIFLFLFIIEYISKTIENKIIKKEV